MAVERRGRKDGIEEAKERHLEIALMIERFETLNRVYDSDIQRLESLEEGGAALLASSNRPCPLCGAGPEHQSHAHGLDEVKLAQQATKAEIAKIRMERSDLVKTVSSLSAESDALVRKGTRLVEELNRVEVEIEQARPQEGALREHFNSLFATRETVRGKLAALDNLQRLRATKAELETFKASGVSKKDITTGISTVTGHELAKCVQDVLHAWQFPGFPTVSFSESAHDILIDGKSRQANGKGVRALMNAAFKIGVMQYCRDKGLPHPGFIVLDSPLLSYREPLTSRYGALSADEEEISRSGVKQEFYKFLMVKRDLQIVIVENDEPPVDLGPNASVTAFAGPHGDGPRGGFF